MPAEDAGLNRILCARLGGADARASTEKIEPETGEQARRSRVSVDRNSIADSVMTIRSSRSNLDGTHLVFSKRSIDCSQQAMLSPMDMEKLVSLCKRRGFLFPFE